jgi:hypothetical protein
MLLVLETRSGVLLLFPSVAGAEARLEAIDIENAEYEFCDASGQRLVGDIIEPVTALDGGKFRLVPHGAADAKFTAALLGRARVLAQPYREAATLDDLRKSLLPAPVPADPTPPA